MTTTKETLDQDDQIRKEGKDQSLLYKNDKLKNKIYELLTDPTKEDEKIEVLTNLFSGYLNMKEREKAEDLNMGESEDIHHDSKGHKEQKETVEKPSCFEDENFRVEDTSNRKEIIDQNGVRVLENPEKDIREYLEGACKGEQLFTDESAKRELSKVGKKLPPSPSELDRVIRKKYKGNYQDFLKSENITFPGRYNGTVKNFYAFDEIFYIRCADGSCFKGNKNKQLFGGKVSEDYGFSVRCLKD